MSLVKVLKLVMYLDPSAPPSVGGSHAFHASSIAFNCAMGVGGSEEKGR